MAKYVNAAFFEDRSSAFKAAFAKRVLLKVYAAGSNFSAVNLDFLSSTYINGQPT